MTIIIGCAAAEFGSILAFRDCLLPSGRFHVASLHVYICASKISPLENFDIDLDFQRHLLQGLGCQAQCDPFGIHFLKID